MEKKNSSANNTGFVCTLQGAELTERKEQLQKELFSKLKKVEETTLGYVFYFDYKEEFILKLTDYMLAENNCCPFFKFELTLESTNDVSLKISGTSTEVKEMIETVLIKEI